MKKENLLVLFLLFLLSLSEFTWAQKHYAITGRVTDAVTGESLIGVTIYVPLLKVGTVTDVDGGYELTLPEGNHSMQISYIGYKTLNVTIKTMKKSQSYDFRLHPDVATLSEVEVKSQRADRNVTQMVMSAQTLDLVAIKKVPALFGEVDVIKTIQLLPGVQPASEGSSGFSVRGGGTDQNLILFDDALIYNASHFLGFFSVFNNDVVKEATLYKGDIPSVYGGRLSSVLDVQTKDEVPPKLYCEGGIGLITSRLAVGVPFNKHRSSFLLAGRTTYVGLFIPLFKKELKGSDVRFYDLNAKFTHVINEKNKLFFTGYMGRDRFVMQGMMGMGYGNKSGTLRWSHIFGERLSSNLFVIASDYDYNIDIVYDKYDFTIKAGTRDYKMRYDFAMAWDEEHFTRFGVSTGFVNFDQGQLEDRGGGLSQYLGLDQQLSVSRKALDHALFLAHEWNMTPRFSLRLGMRLSAFQNIGAEQFFVFDDSHQVIDTMDYSRGEVFNTFISPEPRVSALFRINETSSVKASYSRTAQYAQVASASTGGLPFDVWFPCSPNIKPQIGNQYAVGLFKNFDNDAFETSVELYYKDLKNVIDFKDNASTMANLLIDGELRVGKGRSYGVELLLRKNVGSLTGWVSYTFSRSFRTIPEINFGEEYRSPYDRPHSFVFLVNYDFTDRISASVNWVYSTGQPVTFPYGQYTYNGVTYAVYNGCRNQSRYPDYHRLDLSFTWKIPPRRWKKWDSELNVSVYNAYGRKNTWAVLFEQGPNNNIVTQKMYLFSVVPSVTYNFKF